MKINVTAEMSISKPDVLFVLSKHSGKWLKSRKIAKELGLDSVTGINRVSNILFRLRNQPYIARRNKSHEYQYRYIEDKSGYPTNILPLSKSDGDKKARGDSDGFTFIETIEPEENLCELCGLWCEVAYQAEKNGCRVFLCKRHGERLDKLLGGYGGEWCEVQNETNR